MRHSASIPLALFGLILASRAAHAQTVEVPNASFEKGVGSPEGWTLSGGKGDWLAGEAAEGTRAVSVTGTGTDTAYWRSAPLPLAPRTVYRLSFRARSVDASGGTPITGPVFCNRDLRKIPRGWKEYSSVFATPRGSTELGTAQGAAGAEVQVDPDSAWLRFGQWHVKGTICFDDVRLALAQPVYESREGIALGEGERLAGNEYRFTAPFRSASRNQSRPLAAHRCGFNTNRWVFGAESDVVYRHRIDGRRQIAASVEVGVNWYRGGELAVSASTDGERWADIGVLSEAATRPFDIPARLLPAREVWVRLAARARRRVGADSDPGSFQVGSYEYRATVTQRRDGEPVTLTGRTRFVAVTLVDPKLSVTILGLGEGLPGGDNAVTMRVENRTGRELRARGSITVSRAGEAEGGGAVSVKIPRGGQTIRIPYEILRTGRLELRIALEGDVRFEAETELTVADLYDASYGERLPGSTPEVGLWWASSGWKVSRTRPVPKTEGRALTIRAARNEAEAAQLVIGAPGGLKQLEAESETLRGPAGAAIPAENVEILRVRYVNVTHPTDATGVAAPWPDPLPPFRGPIDIPPDTNQPLWVRVKVPRDAPAGVYEGAIHLTADGYDARAPIRVEVYDFALPDRMSCTTAFGFSSGNVWRYQKISDPRQRRLVLEKYWASFSAHHISPYDPAPLDRLRVTWPGASDWQGGARDREHSHSGRGSLRVEDDSTTSQISTRYGRLIRIPLQARGSLRLRFWYRTEKEGHPFIVTVGQHDAAGTWLPGRNLDMRLVGSREWRLFERAVTEFAPGAKYVRLALWATVWKEDGSPTGTVWYDDVSLTDAGTGRELVEGGDFEPLEPSELGPSFDWEPWDAAMRRAIDHYRFNSFRLRIPGLGGGTFHSRREPSLLGYSEETPEYRAAFRNYCRALEDHLRRNGWLDEAFVYWFDEPAPRDYEFVMNGFRKLKEAAPNVRRMLTEQVEDELVGGPNVWCPISHNYDHDEAERRRRKGDGFWWYVCTGPKAPYCTLFIDHPATELRVWLWQTWKRGIEGVLVWQTNYWTSSAAYPDRARPQDPYEDPMGWVSGYSTPAGTKRPWGNGDGRFIYPPERAADAAQPETVLDGPVDSIRWEMLRDGIEDYEYMAILKRLLDEKRAKLTAGDYGRLRGLLEVPESISKGMTEFTKDPAPIEARRDEVARAIERLERIR